VGVRRKGREAALQILYAVDVSGVGVEDAIVDYWRHLGVEQEGEDFASILVRGAVSELARIDEIIRGVSQHWRIERMSWVDRNILRLGTFELLGLPDVPRRVTLNEAVELAKRFGTEGSPGFVNGVLDKIASDLGKE